MGTGFVGTYFWIILALYLLPTIVAFMRRHHQRAAITLLNLFLGWTALGWIAALIWSATATRQDVIVIDRRPPGH